MKKTALFFFALIMTQLSFGALTGTFTIPGTPYGSIAAAIADLNTQGVGAGGVTFLVTAGWAETLPSLTAGLITATGTSGNPIIFQKTGGTPNPVITAATPGVSTTVDYIICIAGGDYITFDGIDLQENASNTTATQQMEWGYALVKKNSTSPFDGCQYVTIRNCTITLSKANLASVGIYCGNNTSTSTTALTLTNTTDAMNNCKFYSNTISNAYIGIRLGGFNASSPYTLYDQNNEVGKDGGNNISNYGGSTSTAYGIYAIYQNGIKISNNLINGGTGTSTTLYGIFNSTGTSSNVEITGNNVSITGTSTASSFYGIRNDGGSTPNGNTVNISNNNIHDCGNTGTSPTGALGAIYNSGTPTTLNINGNTVTNITWPSSGIFYGIYTGSPSNYNVFNNEVSYITKGGDGGTIYAINGGTGTVSVHDNNIHHLTMGTAAGAIYGFYTTSSPTNESYYNNTFNNFTNNSAQLIAGIYVNTAAGTRVVYNNTISAFSSAGGIVYGLYMVNSSPNIYKNKIYDLSSGAATGVVRGIYESSSAVTNIYNNFISDLKTPASTDANAVNGIYINSGTTVGIYYNTIYLNAASTGGTTFSATGIYANTTPTVDMRNNLVVNNSTPGPTGYATAYKRSSTTLTTYAAASNNNDFYAGTPGSNNLIFYDGTNAKQTLADYKAFVAPRDAVSISEFPTFLNTTTTPYDLHISATVLTLCESGGTTVSTPLAITDDFDGQPRYPNVGYPDNTASPATAPDIGADEFAGLNPNNSQKTLNMAVILESLYSTITYTMRQAQNGLGQPQFSAPTADQITVELHNPTTPFATAYSIPNVNLNMNDTVSVTIPASYSGSYYIVIRHRNSIETWSANPVSFSGSVTSYNFTDAAGKALGNNLKMVTMFKYGIYAGDVNQDGAVDGSDLLACDNDNVSFVSGYVVTDANGDGSVDGSDLLMIDNNNVNFVGKVTP